MHHFILTGLFSACIDYLSFSYWLIVENMRVLRAKAVRKILRFYRLLFGIAAPYHVSLLALMFISAVIIPCRG